jgi:hypothetical protein
MDKDEFYRDILEGMALYTRSAFQRDVLKTLSRLDEPALAEALNKNQIASKLWLADALFGAVGAELGDVLVLGGWFGVLPAILLHDARFAIAKVTSLDVDPRCAGVALALNDTHVRAGKFAAVTADMVDYDYAGGTNAAGAPKLVVNTSCEHLEAFDRWYGRIPDGQLLALQSNDYFACSEHVNCVPDLAAFRQQAPMRDVLFAGEHKLRRYVRFMLIGRK